MTTNRLPHSYYDNWQRERLIEEVEDLRASLREYLTAHQAANIAMDKAINPNGERRDFIPAAKAIHAENAALRAALTSMAEVAYARNWQDESRGEPNQSNALAKAAAALGLVRGSAAEEHDAMAPGSAL